MEEPTKSESPVIQEAGADEEHDPMMDDPFVDKERSKGLPKGMFVGKDGLVYGFDEEENKRQLAEICKKIDVKKLRAMAKEMAKRRAELGNPDL